MTESVTVLAESPVAANTANDNTRDGAPLLALVASGDGAAFAKALARALVRRELIAAGIVANDADGPKG